MTKKWLAGAAGIATVAVAAGMITWWTGQAETVSDWPGGNPMAGIGVPEDLPPQLDLSTANRRAPVPGLPDWSHAGYREGAGLPGPDDITDDAECVVTRPKWSMTTGSTRTAARTPDRACSRRSTTSGPAAHRTPATTRCR